MQTNIICWGRISMVFCKGKICLTNLVEFFEGLNKHVNKGDMT